MATRPKLKKGMKLFTAPKKGGKYFHFHSAIMSTPISPTLPQAFKTAGDMILDTLLSRQSKPARTAPRAAEDPKAT